MCFLSGNHVTVRYASGAIAWFPLTGGGGIDAVQSALRVSSGVDTPGGMRGGDLFSGCGRFDIPRCSTVVDGGDGLSGHGSGAVSWQSSAEVCDVAGADGAAFGGTLSAHKVQDHVGDVDGTFGVHSEVRGDDVKLPAGAGGRVAGVDSGVTRGRWYEHNRRRKEKRKENRLRGDVDEQSSCPSYGQAVSDAEREAKETLARRRAAENKLKEKLALMKIASLEDEKKCREYADLKHHRMVQWTNEAVAKSQQSLEKCKSIDPGSSASQHEIRMQAKELADLKFSYSQLVENVQLECGNVARFLPKKSICTESLERHQLEGEMYGEIDSHAEIYD